MSWVPNFLKKHFTTNAHDESEQRAAWDRITDLFLVTDPVKASHLDPVHLYFKQINPKFRRHKPRDGYGILIDHMPTKNQNVWVQTGMRLTIQGAAHSLSIMAMRYRLEVSVMIGVLEIICKACGSTATHISRFYMTQDGLTMHLNLHFNPEVNRITYVVAFTRDKKQGDEMWRTYQVFVRALEQGA